MRHDEEVQRRREEMEAQAERATAQQRHLQDDVRAVRAEARERAEQADRLKIKYDHMIKSLGGGGGEGEEKSEEGKDKVAKVNTSTFHNFSAKLILSMLECLHI